MTTTLAEFIIAAFHMCRTAEFLPPNSVSLAYPGFMSGEDGTKDIVAKIEGLGPSKTDTVGLSLLSNTTDASQYGSNHITGTLTTASPTTIEKTHEQCSLWLKNLLTKLC
jgi:hypothetical protein